MAVPKKKVSRSRRNMRRFSAAYQLDPVTVTTDTNGELVRPHTVTLASLDAYIAARTQRKAARKSASAAK
ncbi:MAG: 50S ribosomal protein L32 [Oligoflexia bacterium]|nr:50S ribosomal protein L32 [Oligoflexia bacterium]